MLDRDAFDGDLIRRLEIGNEVRSVEVANPFQSASAHVKAMSLISKDTYLHHPNARPRILAMRPVTRQRTNIEAIISPSMTQKAHQFDVFRRLLIPGPPTSIDELSFSGE